MKTLEELFGVKGNMTKEEAIMWLKNMRDGYSDAGNEFGEELDSKLETSPDSGLDKPSETISGFTNRLIMALDMAIESLESVKHTRRIINKDIYGRIVNFYCENCGPCIIHFTMGNYCPNCGAKIEEEIERTINYHE